MKQELRAGTHVARWGSLSHSRLGIPCEQLRVFRIQGAESQTLLPGCVSLLQQLLGGDFWVLGTQPRLLTLPAYRSRTVSVGLGRRISHTQTLLLLHFCCPPPCPHLHSARCWSQTQKAGRSDRLEDLTRRMQCFRQIRSPSRGLYLNVLWVFLCNQVYISLCTP